MSTIENGGTGIVINGQDNTGSAFESAQKNLVSFSSLAEQAAHKFEPFSKTINGSLIAGTGISALAAMGSGFFNVSNAAKGFGDTISNSSKVLNNFNGNCNNSGNSAIKFGVALVSVAAILKGISSSAIGIFNMEDSIKSSLTWIDSLKIAEQVEKEKLSRLDQLAHIQDKNKKEINETENLVGQLNSMYDGLNLSVDTNTGAITGQTEETRKLINSQIEFNLSQSICTKLGIKNADVTQRNAASLLLLSNAEAGNLARKNALTVETYKNITASIKKALFGQAETQATNLQTVSVQRQTIANRICSVSNTIMGISAKGAAAGFLAMTASMATNPLGWILLAVEGVVALCAAIGGLIGWFASGKSAAQQYADSTMAVMEAHDKIRETDEIYIQRLEQLQEKESLSIKEKQEIQKKIEELNGKYNGLNLTIDAQTGKVKNVAGQWAELRNIMRDQSIKETEDAIKAQNQLIDEQTEKLAYGQTSWTRWAGAWATFGYVDTGDEQYKKMSDTDKTRKREDLQNNGNSGWARWWGGVFTMGAMDNTTEIKDQMSEVENNLKSLKEKQEKLNIESDKDEIDAIKQKEEQEKKRLLELKKMEEDNAKFILEQERVIRQAKMTNLEKELNDIEMQFKEKKDALQDVITQREKIGQSASNEKEQLAKIIELEKQKKEIATNKAAEAEAQRIKQIHVENMKVVKNISDEIQKSQQNAMKNELDGLHASVKARREILQAAINEGKATQENIDDLKELNDAEKKREEQIRKKYADEIKESNMSFANTQAERKQKIKDEAENKALEKSIAQNPFDAIMTLTKMQKNADDDVKNHNNAVLTRRALAAKDGIYDDTEKKEIAGLEKQLADAQGRQSNVGGLLEQAQRAAQDRVNELIGKRSNQQYSGPLESKMSGTVEAYRAEIENQNRGKQRDPQVLKLDELKKLWAETQAAAAKRQAQLVTLTQQMVKGLGVV